MYFIKEKRGFAAMLGLLITAIITAVVFFIMLNSYFKKRPIDRPFIDEKTGEALEETGIDTLDYGSVLESTKRKVDNINRRSEERYKGYAD